MFQSLARLSPDSILGLMAQYRADTAPNKVDLGVGVYRDVAGNTPVLRCVRQAEQAVIYNQNTKSYVAPGGREEFNMRVEELVLGNTPGLTQQRYRTAQTPGGSGALRVGAELIRLSAPTATVYVSNPSWANHPALLGSSGLKLESYPYYDPAAHVLKFIETLEYLDQARVGDVVLLHACCHNPTGADWSLSQWQQVLDLLKHRQLIPFIDLAYQGFGRGLNEDVEGLRLIFAALPEALVAVSFSKNLGLYRERVGALIVQCEDSNRAEAVHSHVLKVARSIYSMPPDHGAAIAALVMGDATLKEDWVVELNSMRTRIEDMRALLTRHLNEATASTKFDFIKSQRGMFSLLGVSSKIVDQLRQRHVYMTADSRMNLAGIMPHNVAYVAESISICDS